MTESQAEVRIVRHSERLRKPRIIIRVYNLVRPPRVPPEHEMEACPDYFFCYSCGSKHKKREYAATYQERRICRQCEPYVDVNTIAWLIDWEEKHPAKGVGPFLDMSFSKCKELGDKPRPVKQENALRIHVERHATEELAGRSLPVTWPTKS